MGGGDPRERASRWVTGVLLLLGLGCATPAFVEEDRGFRHRSASFRVASPALLAPEWSRVSVQGDALSFEGPGNSLMSLQASCRPRRANVQMLAHHLHIGLPEHAQRKSGPVRVGTMEGWSRTFDVRSEEGVVRVRTITGVHGDCVLDWVLTGGTSFEDAQPLFDAWWGSFEPEPEGEEAR